MRVTVDWRTSFSLVGAVLAWLAVPLSACLGLALYEGTSVGPFLVAIALSLVVGLGLRQLADDWTLHDREAFLMVAMTWLAIALVGAVPFRLAGTGVFDTWIDAVFESTSGITTTGATVVMDFEAHSRALLLWRQVIQWLGGLGILLIATAVLARLSVGGAKLMETETQTRDVTKLTSRFADTAKLLLGLYVGITTLIAGLLWALGLLGIEPEMTAFDAVSHALTSVATAGFSPRPESAGAFGPAAQWVLVAAMAVSATNFVLLWAVLRGDVDRIRRSEEFRFYLGILVVLSALLAAILVVDGEFDGGLETVRHAVFQIVSLVTTTGYATVDFELWSAPAKQLLFVCFFIGGMAGSTTCSIKTFRWLVVAKAVDRDMIVAAKPTTVRPVRLSGDVVDEETVREVYSYTLLSLLFFLLGSVALVMLSARVGHAVTEFEALGAAASTFFNIGPAFGQAGPFDSYHSFPAASKVLMTLLMWIGRIEIVPVLVLLRLSFWTRP
jgi:trk system potassium uptake protein TrkH